MRSTARVNAAITPVITGLALKGIGSASDMRRMADHQRRQQQRWRTAELRPSRRASSAYFLPTSVVAGTGRNPIPCDRRSSPDCLIRRWAA